MKNDENKEQITNLVVNMVFIFDLENNNNYNSARFGMQKFIVDMSGVLAKLTTIFIQSSGVFT
jgi:hypothetical protein